jgi:hypothetical protein
MASVNCSLISLITNRVWPGKQLISPIATILIYIQVGYTVVCIKI